jgi:acyl dehydratase
VRYETCPSNGRRHAELAKHLAWSGFGGCRSWESDSLRLKLSRQRFEKGHISMPPLAIENIEAMKDLVGREFAITDWFEVTQQRIQQFADATEDRQWIHLDADRAQKDSPYGTTIAHGFMTLSLLSHFSKHYGLNRVRFSAAVPAGSNIRARFTLQSLKDVGKSAEAVFSVVIELQKQSKPACVAEWVIRIYR